MRAITRRYFNDIRQAEREVLAPSQPTLRGQPRAAETIRIENLSEVLLCVHSLSVITTYNFLGGGGGGKVDGGHESESLDY